MKQQLQTLRTRLADWYGDSWNPVLVKELRQDARSRLFLTALGLSPAGYIIVFYLLLSLKQEWIGTMAERADLCTAVFCTYSFICFLVVLAIGGLSATRWSMERSSDSITPEYTTALPAWTIVMGKFYASVLSAGVVLLIHLPPLVLLWTQMKQHDSLHFIFFPLLLLPVLYAGSLFLAAANTQSQKRKLTGHTGSVWVLLIIFIFPLFGLTSSMFHHKSTDGYFFLLYWGLFCMLVLSLMLAHALILPRTANRMFAPRLSAMCCYIATLILLACGVVTDERSWMYGISWFFSLILLISGAVERFEDSERMKHEFAECPPSLRPFFSLLSTGCFRALSLSFLFAVVALLINLKDISEATAWSFAAVYLYFLSYALAAVAIRKCFFVESQVALIVVLAATHFPVVLMSFAKGRYLSVLSPFSVGQFDATTSFGFAVGLLAAVTCALFYAFRKKNNQSA